MEVMATTQRSRYLLRRCYTEFPPAVSTSRLGVHANRGLLSPCSNTLTAVCQDVVSFLVDNRS